MRKPIRNGKGKQCIHSVVTCFFWSVILCVWRGVLHERLQAGQPQCRSRLPPGMRQGLSLVCCSAHPSSRPSWISPVSTWSLTAPTAELRPHGFYSISGHSTSGSHACAASSSPTWLSCQPDSGILEAGHQRRKEKSRGISGQLCMTRCLGIAGVHSIASEERTLTKVASLLSNPLPSCLDA